MIRLLLLLVALGAGATAIVMFLSQPAPVPAPVVQTPVESVEDTAAAVVPERDPVVLRDVLVAATSIEQGERLREEMLRWRPMEENIIRDSYILEEDEPDAIARAVQLASVAPLDPGEPIRWERLQTPRPPTLAARLTPGKRAVAVAVSAESTAGGFVLPEDRVDVLLVGGGGASPRTQVVVSNVRVIALDQTTIEDVSGDTFLSSTATLELDTAQMQAVMSAREASGRLILALRSLADGEEPQEMYTPPERNIIRVIRDGRVEEIEVSP